MRTLLTAFVLSVFLLLPSTLLSQKGVPDRIAERAQRALQLRAEADSMARALGLPIRVERADGTLIELQRFENGIPKYYKTDNSNAAATISSNKVHPAGGMGYSLTGSGVLLGEWDGGKVRTTHQELTGRVTSPEGGLNFHSTHVAGTMIGSGVNANARGMSYQGTLTSHDWNSDDVEMTIEAAAGLKVSNHSYGFITGWDFDYYGDSKWVWFGDSAVSETEDYSFGFYDTQAEDWDLTAVTYPNYLIVKSAGNDRNEGPSGAVNHWFFKSGVKTASVKARSKDGNVGYDCVGGAGIAKNLLTVGAIADIPAGYSTPGGVVMSSFSCWGPTDDGRIKPDIVANGVSLFSSLETADNAYGSLSGTSMAAPNASGSIGLLLHHQANLHGATPLRSSTMKAIIINTADEAGLNPGPDYSNGWGLMNTLKAVQLMTQDTVDGTGTHIRQLNLPQGTTAEFEISSDGILPMKATIGWIDAPGTPSSASLDPSALKIVNDLDMRIIKNKDLTTYTPWILNPAVPSAAATTGDNFRDNVEQIYIAAPERAVYTVRITHKGGTLSGASQNYSFVISGNVASIGPIVISTPDTVDHTLIPGGIVQDSIRIVNEGDTLYTFEVFSDTSLSWLTILEDSGSVGSLDTTYLHYTLNAAGLTQWTDFTTNVTLNGNTTPIIYPFTLHTTGPMIETSPTYIVVDVDSAEVGVDTLTIRNIGFTPLSYVIRDNGGSFPVWMTVDDTSGTIAPNDSAIAVMTFNAVSQLIGDYTTFIDVASTDTATGTVTTQTDLHVGTRYPYDVSVHNRWNLVSLPVLPFTYYKNSLYPTASSPAYAFTGSGYLQKDTLANGTGYWLKFPSAQTVTIDGYTFTADTIPVSSGWNIVGAISEPVSVGAITTTPASILTSGFFQYDPGYSLADSLRPGRGYFVQANQAGSLLVNSGAAALPKATVKTLLAAFNTLIIEDAAKNSQTLYFGGTGALDRTLSAMPPAPPAGSFDARFASGSLVESMSPVSGEREFGIRVLPVSSPVTVRWTIQKGDTRRYMLRDETGAAYDLARSGSITVSGTGNQMLTLSTAGPQVPTEFALQQNYPNPFNPSTKISYEVPTEGLVTIKVYNILGNEVATIVNAVLEAGYHTAVFDASALPSGVYIYKMQSEKFADVKKMMLMR